MAAHEASVRPPPLSPACPAPVDSGADVIEILDPAMRSRLLYSNPVCLLTTGCMGGTGPRNVMTISWLSPVNNSGAVFLSMNSKRYTSELMAEPGAYFVLNIPVAGMEDLIRAVGKCSGRVTDKFTALGLTTCYPGWHYPDASAESTLLDEPSSFFNWRNFVAISDCVAHIICEVTSVQLSCPNDQDQIPGRTRKGGEAHYLIQANIKKAFVKMNYWDGKCFAALSDTDKPTLTFLGSGNFGYMRR